jgi:hypothetical protein
VFAEFRESLRNINCCDDWESWAKKMDRTLAEHIQTLEQKLNLISAHIMQENNPKKRNQLESELRAVESALTQYRSAFEIESHLSMIP